ncbi:MAG: helix-turn-helix transcriptional regulator [Raoultibacter sp.]
MIIIGVISGMGVGWCFLQWFYLYSKLNLKDATGYMLLSFSLVAVVTYLLTALATILNVSPLLLMAPLPIIAIPLCERSFTRLALDTTQEHRDKTAISHEQLRLRQIIPIAIELAVYALVLGLLRSQGAQTNDFGTSVQLNLLLRTVFPLILVLWIGVWLKPKGLINVAQAILIIIIIALLALALLGDAGTEVAAALVSLARNIVLVLLSVMLLYLAQTSPYHPFTVYGTGRFIHTLSTQIGFFLMTISVNNETIGVSLNVFFFITACLFVFLANRSLKTVQLFYQDNYNSALYQSNNKVVDKRCDEIRDDFGLTDREVEVMKLLAKGRSRGYIAETLVISENTVRWHAKGLYTKLNIHSKQELLTLIELT